MNDEVQFDAEIAHAMNQWVLMGLIKALSVHQPTLPWDITEIMSNIRKDELDPKSLIGMSLARTWIWENFTKDAPPTDSPI